MPLLRYHYFQPKGGRFHYNEGGGDDLPTFTLIYAGSLPAGPCETTEDLLDRLWMRHTSELRPHEAGVRGLGTGDLLDLGDRGLWQVVPLGFREVAAAQVRIEAAA